MKTCEEMVNSLLERRAQYVSAQRKKKKVLARTITALCAVAMVGVAVWQMPSITEQPPVTMGDTTVPWGTTTTAETAVTTTPTTDRGIVSPTVTVTDTTLSQSMDTTMTTTQKTEPTASKTQSTTGKTQPTETVTQTQTTATQTQPTQTTVTTPSTATQTKPTQTTGTTQPTTTEPTGGDPVDPLPPWPCLWLYCDMRQKYEIEEIPIYFKLEGFEEVDPNWVKETSYTANGFSIVGDISVERDAETGGLIYRMVLAYDGVTPRPSFFFNVVSIDGIKQTAGLYGYLADHGFFVSVSYDSAVSYSYYYLVETGVLTFDEYQRIMEKYWSESVNGSVSWS